MIDLVSYGDYTAINKCLASKFQSGWISEYVASEVKILQDLLRIGK